MPNRNQIVRIVLVTGIGLVAAMNTGCSKLGPSNFKRMLTDMTDVSGRKRFDSSKYYVQPDAQTKLKESSESENSVDVDPNELESNAFIVLPEESQTVAIQDKGRESGDFPRDEPIRLASAKVDEIVPSGEVISQPLAPLSFDDRERKKLGGEVESLRTERRILLTANPASDLSTVKTQLDKDRVQSLVPIDASYSIAPNSIPEVVELDSETQSQTATILEPAEEPLLIEEQDVLASLLPPYAEPPEWCAMAESEFAMVDMSTTNLPPLSGTEVDDQILFVDQEVQVPDHNSNEFEPPVTNGWEVSHESTEYDSDSDFVIPACREPNAIGTDKDASLDEIGIVKSDTSSEFGATEVKVEDPVDANWQCPANETSTADFNPIVQASHASPVKPDLPESQPLFDDVPDPIVEDQESNELRLANVSFCTSVSGFGHFTAFPENSFQPNQRLLVYCEIENYTSVKSLTPAEVCFRTRLRGSYQILDAQGQTVDQKEFPVVEDVAETERSEFYVHLPVRLGELPSGSYRLQVVIEDLNGGETAELRQLLEFVVE